MDPITIALLGGAAAGASGPILGEILSQSATAAQGRELREIFNLRAALGKQFLDPEEYSRDIEALLRYAQKQPFGPQEMKQFDRELMGAQAGEALASQRAVAQNLSAMDVGPQRGGAIAAEQSRVRRLLANMARANIGSYAAQQNVGQLEQTRQALASALADRYGTLSQILAAGV